MLASSHVKQPDTPRVDELVPGFGQTAPASSAFRFHPNRRVFHHVRYRIRPAATWLDRLEVHLARQIINDDRLIQNAGSTLLTDEANESQLDGPDGSIQFNGD